MTDFSRLIATRRNVLHFCLGTPLFGGFALIPARVAADVLLSKFYLLKEKSISNCFQGFLDSISSLPDATRLQGSCCGPMDLHRYKEQIEGLRRYKAIEEIPPDPYDIHAGLAKRLLAAYDVALEPQQQQAYDHAMEASSEKGPCCCECWRWHVYGGLGKLLIRDQGFDGATVAKIWDLSDGCGGADHVH